MVVPRRIMRDGWLGGELSLVIHVSGRRIMSEIVGDRSLIDVRGLDMCAALDKPALARVLALVLAAGAEEPSLSFNANI
jgi:hypothetical protein